VCFVQDLKPISLRNRYFKISPGEVGKFKFSLVAVRVSRMKEKINNVTDDCQTTSADNGQYLGPALRSGDMGG
jgi:hypothetical protein